MIRAAAALSLFVALSGVGGVVGCDCGAEPVLERRVELTLVPEVVDFGDVPLGARADAAIIVRNDGNAPWEPEGPPLLDGEGFTWLSGCDFAVAPGAACTAQLRFIPTFEGAALASFTVQFPDKTGAAVNVVGRLDGNGTPPTILIAPPSLDFGAVVVGSSRTSQITVENRGDEVAQLPLSIAGAAFFVDGADATEVFVDAGDTVAVDVVFAPSAGIEFDGVLTAELCGIGCGPAVGLHGVGQAPRIDVEPRSLDLGAVERGDRATGRLHISNIGSGALAVEGVGVDDDSGAFSIVAPALPLVLNEGEGADVDVEFAPVEGRGADNDVFVVVRSSDPVSSSVVIPVHATSPGPGLEIIPRAAHYGFLAPGAERRLSVVLRSTGDAAVDIGAVRVVGDSDYRVEGAPTGALAPNAAVQFFVTATANAAAVARGGSTAEIVVTSDAGEERAALTFAAGVSGCVARAVVAHANLGAVQVGLSRSGDVLIENIGDAACHLDRIDSGAVVGLADDEGFDSAARGLNDLAPGGSGIVSFGFAPEREGARAAVRAVYFDDVLVPVLVSASGNGVRGGLVGAPGVVDLGPTPRDCSVPSANVAFFNDGETPVVVDTLEVDPPNSGFSVSPLTLPFALLPGQSVPLVVSGDFGSAVDGINIASLTAATEEGLSADIALRFTAVATAAQITESFEVSDESLVDVLFVVDNSGSMADDQQLLADNFADFIAVAFDDPNLDIQLGITTTDVISEGAAAGRLIGAPPIMDANDGFEFSARAQVGIDGTGLELGLEAMRLALEVPENARFIRSDAALAVIFVTDEEDSGDLIDFLPDPALSRAPEEYIALLEARKAGAVQNTPVLVSAVLPPFSPRYRTVVSHFGGTVLDIVSPTWGTQLSQVAQDTFSLSRTFQLGTRPRPNTVSVTVDGEALATSDFTVDPDRRSVILNEPAEGGAEVVITYTPQCG